MPIYVDDIELKADAETLEDALHAAKERLDAAGRIIVEISVAGEALVGDDIQQHLGDYIGDTDVRLVSANPREESISALGQIREKLDEAARVQSDVADKLQRDEEADAMSTLDGLLEIWIQSNMGILNCATMMNVSLDNIKVNGKKFSDLITALKLRINELYEYRSNQDLVAIADTLKYEWPELTEDWKAVVDSVIAAIDEK